MLSEIPKLLSSIEDSHHGPSDAMHNPPQPLKDSQKTIVSFLMEITLNYIDFLTLKHQSDTKVFTMTMEILPDPTSNKLCGRLGLTGSLILCCLLWDAPVMRKASAAAKTCQGDSSEFYLITGNPDDGCSWFKISQDS
ncbi:hypothetical protein Tco_1121099 [Tanacetum coccineum]|uniref:Uncharacterized protein n=1 Tax=Tanacetum coccineum TaxID=301880 RepID=A0ABQ5IWX9_9ASTR